MCHQCAVLVSAHLMICDPTSLPFWAGLLQGVDNLFERMERMVAYGPLFCDITWGAGGSTADVTLDIATRMQNTVRVAMHKCTSAVQLCMHAVRLWSGRCVLLDPLTPSEMLRHVH